MITNKRIQLPIVLIVALLVGHCHRGAGIGISNNSTWTPIDETISYHVPYSGLKALSYLSHCDYIAHVCSLREHFMYMYTAYIKN